MYGEYEYVYEDDDARFIEEQDVQDECEEEYCENCGEAFYEGELVKGCCQACREESASYRM